MRQRTLAKAVADSLGLEGKFGPLGSRCRRNRVSVYDQVHGGAKVAFREEPDGAT